MSFIKYIKEVDLADEFNHIKGWASRNRLKINVDKTTRLVVSVAQLVGRWTHNRKIVGSIPTNAVCFTVVR